LRGLGASAPAARRALAREGAIVLGLPPDRLGHERLLVAALEAVHRDCHRRRAVFAARHAHRDRSGHRVGTASGARDGRGETVLRTGEKEGLNLAAIPLSSPRSRSAPMASLDAVIVGGCHNGLVAAAYLAKACLRCLGLERRSIAGGACVTGLIYPGCCAS